MDEVTVAILAGGLGSRLGGADKGLIRLGDEPLAERLLKHQPPGMPRLIVANRNLERYRRFGVPVVVDPWPDYRGPLAGMLAALRAAATPWVLCLPCDAARLPVDLLARLLRAAREQWVPAVHARAAEQDHYVCCLLARRLEPLLDQALAQGERAPRRWFADIDARPVDFSDVRPEPIWSLNTDGELEAARAVRP